jgi:ribosomal protein L32
MAVPKRKVSKSRRDKRSTGKGLVKKNVIFVNGEPTLRHVKLNYIPKKVKQTSEEK